MSRSPQTRMSLNWTSFGRKPKRQTKSKSKNHLIKNKSRYKRIKRRKRPELQNNRNKRKRKFNKRGYRMRKMRRQKRRRSNRKLNLMSLRKLREKRLSRNKAFSTLRNPSSILTNKLSSKWIKWMKRSCLNRTLKLSRKS